ncbi:phosphoribosylformylglycinamidine cyclo-ligase [bacterium]|nr:phosphoribosylformylglycinamidine cyclo-ligase [bacterium]
MDHSKDHNNAAGRAGQPLTYSESGVSIEAQDDAIARFKAQVESTFAGAGGGRVLAGVGSFGAAFAPDFGSLSEPVLVSSTDGIGTKVRLHARFGTHAWAGRDLVSAVVNDVACLGARPLFFLDYLACNKLEPAVAHMVVGEGMAGVCHEIGCALIGGELAEMGSTYQPGEYDLAGFAVGMVDRAKAWGADKVREGAALIGVASSGAHCNGYSLLRRIFEPLPDEQWLAPHSALGESLKDALLRPTLCYAPLASALAQQDSVQSAAHISGGGLSDNMPRVIPEGLCARVSRSALRALAQAGGTQALFDLVNESASIEPDEFARVLNMGVGFVLAVEPAGQQAALEQAQALGYTAALLGEVAGGESRFAWQD